MRSVRLNRGMALRLGAVGVLSLVLSAHVPAHEKVGRAVLTFYWVADETAPQYRGKTTPAVLRDTAGRVLAHTTRKFKLELVRQGAGWLRDGRTVIFVKRVGDESRFRVTKSKYGLGSNGCRLIPYKTVAVDPRFVKLGTKVYIPQLKGAQLPDGTIHDGMFIASDRGNFRGAHVDVFVGASSPGPLPFTRKGYRSRSYVTVYSVRKSVGCRP